MWHGTRTKFQPGPQALWRVTDQLNVMVQYVDSNFWYIDMHPTLAGFYPFLLGSPARCAFLLYLCLYICLGSPARYQLSRSCSCPNSHGFRSPQGLARIWVSTLRSMSLLFICFILQPYALLNISLYVYVLICIYTWAVVDNSPV